MFILSCSIEIGAFTFKQVNNVTIVKSVDLLADTAIIKLPTSALFGNQNEGFYKQPIENVIKAGDAVKVTLAYLGDFENVEFEGFVKFIKPNVPTVSIECEDLIYKIRQKRINKNFRKTNLKTVLNEIISGTGVELAGDIPEVNFDRFILKNVNGAKALNKIKENYGLYVFIDNNNKLYAGLKQAKGFGDNVIFDLDKNVINHDLRFRSADDVSLYVKVIGVTSDNKKVTVMVGEEDGEQRTLYKYNVTDPKQLKQIGEAELSSLKYDGYEGSITSFLVPFVDRGFSATILDRNFPDRKGVYFVPKVEISFGVGGARRKVELGTKIE